LRLEFVFGDIHGDLSVFQMRDHSFHGGVHSVDLFLDILDSGRVFLSNQFEDQITLGSVPPNKHFLKNFKIEVSFDPGYRGKDVI
jgi:hypothetical protein